MLNKNEIAPEIGTDSISGHHVYLSGLRGNKVLIKFHRFSGCPVAQCQIDEYISRQNELNAAGVKTIVFMHNSKDKIVPRYQEVKGLYIIADKQKKFYQIFGAQFLISKMFSLSSWMATFKSFVKGYYPLLNRFQGSLVGVPSDFLINEKGVIVDMHYGTHFGDSWSVTEVLSKV